MHTNQYKTSTDEKIKGQESPPMDELMSELNELTTELDDLDTSKSSKLSRHGMKAPEQNTLNQTSPSSRRKMMASINRNAVDHRPQSTSPHGSSSSSDSDQTHPNQPSSYPQPQVPPSVQYDPALSSEESLPPGFFNSMIIPETDESGNLDETVDNRFQRPVSPKMTMSPMKQTPLPIQPTNPPSRYGDEPHGYGGYGGYGYGSPVPSPILRRLPNLSAPAASQTNWPTSIPEDTPLPVDIPAFHTPETGVIPSTAGSKLLPATSPRFRNESRNTAITMNDSPSLRAIATSEAMANLRIDMQKKLENERQRCSQLIEENKKWMAKVKELEHKVMVDFAETKKPGTNAQLPALQAQVKDLKAEKIKYMELYKDAVNRAEKKAQTNLRLQKDMRDLQKKSVQSSSVQNQEVDQVKVKLAETEARLQEMQKQHQTELKKRMFFEKEALAMKGRVEQLLRQNVEAELKTVKQPDKPLPAPPTRSEGKKPMKEPPKEDPIDFDKFQKSLQKKTNERKAKPLIPTAGPAQPKSRIPQPVQDDVNTNPNRKTWSQEQLRLILEYQAYHDRAWKPA